LGKKNSYYWIKRLAVLAVLAGLGIFLSIELLQNQAPAAVPNSIQPLVLTSQSSAYSVAPYIRLFEDRQKNLSFQKILARYKSGGGSKLQNDRIFLGYTSSPYWIVFTVENRNPGQSLWILDLGSRINGTAGAADRLELFSDANPDQALLIDGRHVKNKIQLQGQKKNALPLALEPKQAKTFALRIEPTPGTPLALTPRLVEQAGYQDISNNLAFTNNTLLVTAFLLIGISLLFLLRYKSLTPALLILYTAAQFLIYMSADEIVSQGNNTGVAYLDVLHALAAMAALLLTQQILFPDQKEPTAMSRLITPATLTVAIIAVLGLVSAPAAEITTPLLLRFLPLALPAFIFMLCWPAVTKWNVPQTRLYALSWLVLLSGAFLTEAAMSGATAFSEASISLYSLGFSLHIVLLSFASLRFTGTVEFEDRAQLLAALEREEELFADLARRDADHLEALGKVQQVADTANKEKTAFLAIVSHEIRTPMTGIMGMIRLLMDTPLNAKQKEYIDTLQYSCNALLALINDILDFSKVGVKKMDIESISFDLGRLIEGVIPLMSSRADEKKIALKTEVDPKTPRLLKGDPTRIRQILLNLIGNSIKFTDKGSVTLIVKPTGLDENGRHKIYFAVKDTGIGMPPEVQKTVFVPYAQGHASIARRYGGTGLGLSISQQLTAAMGGMVEMTSAVGVGTTFYFTLAFEEGAAVEEDTAAAAIEAKPIKILVVDDNPINQKVVAGILEKDKHTIVTVGGAREALDEIRKLNFDVILMDMEMPDIDGPAATRMIRALPDREKAAIPVVAMTSNTSPEDLDICFKAGMNASCSKPINLEQLRALLLQVANKEGPFSVSGAPARAPEKAEAPPAKPAAGLFNPETLGTLKTSMTKAQLDDMMKSFYEKTEELIAAAEKAVADKDLKALAGRAHDIKGMTSNFGLMALSEVGSQLDHQAKEKAPIETIARTVRQLRPVYADTRKTIDEWIKT